MARLGRYFLPDQPLHVIQRGNNRQPIFFCEGDYLRLHGWLAEAAAAHHCAVHAYVLMTNHLHLLVTPGNQKSLPRTMQALGRRYVRHVNAASRRTGTLWEGRYRAAPIDSEAYFLACCRYIELNPVRAAWSCIRVITYGRATVRTRSGQLMPCSGTIRSIAGSVARRPNVGGRTGRCLGHPLIRLFSTSYAPPQTADGRWATSASS
jgi:REP element-mobilizing transposase RayT